MGYKNVMKTILDPIGSLVGESIFDDMGSKDDEDKERDRINGVRQGYAKGGMVMKSKKSKKPPGSGCAARTKRTKKY